MKEMSRWTEAKSVFHVDTLATTSKYIYLSYNPSTSLCHFSMGAKSQLLRDIRKRISADQFEVQRRAFLYVARNTALSNTVRHKAQLGLNALNGGEGRMHAVKNRCVETGRGRGELRMLLS
jgi:small subunit ribosomal protein S14